MEVERNESERQSEAAESDGRRQCQSQAKTIAHSVRTSL